MKPSLKMMCVVPHPDDEALGMGFTLAKYAAEGVEITIVMATRGERGWAGAEEDFPGPQELGKIREAELLCSARILGVKEVVFLDYIDGELDQVVPAEAIQRIVYHIRRVRPQVVVTFDPFGAYGHPDHIALSQYTLGAVVRAADVGFEDLAGLLPHRVDKVYFMVDTQPVVEMYKTLVGEPITFRVDGEARQHMGWPDWAATTRIDATAFWETNLKAIACHQTQVQGLLDKICQIPERFGIETWAVQTFYRVYSLVNGGRQVEADLFEGLR